MMKISYKKIFVACLTILCILSSCSSKEDDSSKTSKIKFPVFSGCYTARYGGDTALLTLTSKVSQVTGTLKFIDSYGNVDYGTIKGVIKGDTLMADYNFRSYNKQWYRNPLAFLKKNNKLYMGVGQFLVFIGRPYFAKNVPINFNKGKYVFEISECSL